MKNFGIYVFVLLLTSSGLILSCSKSTKPDGFSYTLSGVQDFTMGHDSTIYVPLSMVLTSGTKEPVTLTLSGLPTGVTATPTTLTGTPSFNGTFRLDAISAPQGSYPITLTAASASTGTKSYNFNLNLTTPSDCGAYIAGAYTGTSSQYTGNYIATITRMDTNTIMINKFNGSSTVENIFAAVHCNSDIITMPVQYIGAFYFVFGNGTFTKNSVSLNYFIINSTTDTTAYTATYSR